MAEAAVTVTETHKWDDGKAIHLCGTLAIGASPGTYTTGGIALDLLTSAGIIGAMSQPVYAEVHGIAGYKYEYDKANKKLIIRQMDAGTPAGTLAAHTHDLFLKNADQADAANNRVNAATDKLGANTGSNITVTGLAAGGSGHGGVVGLAAGSPAFTGTASTPAALSQIPASAIPSGVSGDTIEFHAIFKKFA